MAAIAVKGVGIAHRPALQQELCHLLMPCNAVVHIRDGGTAMEQSIPHIAGRPHRIWRNLGPRQSHAGGLSGGQQPEPQAEQGKAWQPHDWHAKAEQACNRQPPWIAA